jgi:hypothetical protein
LLDKAAAILVTSPKQKKLPMKNQKITSITIILSCLACLPFAQAISPTPDGCYPGFTTAEGCGALNSLTTGAGNTGLGWRSLFLNSSASFNTGVGAGALTLNNGDSNTAVGAVALLLNTSGTQNTAVGTDAMVFNDTGSNNTAVGAFALENAISGNYITAIGANAGTDPGIVGNNVYIGDPGFPGDENVISIGGIAASGTPYELTFIGGIYGASVNTGTALPVYVDTDGHLGTNLVNASGQKVRTRGPQRAQPQANLNEFQKQQKRIVELESTVTRLVATVKDQAAKIEKVSAQLELRKPAGRVVTNKH